MCICVSERSKHKRHREIESEEAWDNIDLYLYRIPPSVIFERLIFSINLAHYSRIQVNLTTFFLVLHHSDGEIIIICDDACVTSHASGNFCRLKMAN